MVHPPTISRGAFLFSAAYQEIATAFGLAMTQLWEIGSSDFTGQLSDLLGGGSAARPTGTKNKNTLLPISYQK